LFDASTKVNVDGARDRFMASSIGFDELPTACQNDPMTRHVSGCETTPPLGSVDTADDSQAIVVERAVVEIMLTLYAFAPAAVE
jgi:hypothetical protein